MRALLVILIMAGLGGLFYYQKHSGSQPATNNSEAAKPATVQVVQQNSVPKQPSEHNWMKRSLDRASDVAGQSRARTKQAQDP